MPGEKGYYSDVPAGFGMWDNHRMFWRVFQRQSTAETGGGDGGEEEVASGTDLAEMVKQLARIADAVEYMCLTGQLPSRRVWDGRGTQRASSVDLHLPQASADSDKTGGMWYTDQQRRRNDQGAAECLTDGPEASVQFSCGIIPP